MAKKREVPEAGRTIHQSLILGLNGAAKSHFGPILAHWAANTLFKTSIQGPEYCFCVDIEPLLKKWRAVPYTANLELKKVKNVQKHLFLDPF